ncbi:hypothetical protein ACTL32_09485 [Planococcus sp. FY231025]|uniref:hypothetical protein n=1 Tax=Planococcus sp. FY231025 TaxID=3455699 RepID=UPI003F8F79A6
MNRSTEENQDVFTVDESLALFAWELSNSAKSLEEASIMRKNRASYFASLYDDIIIHQSRYSDGSDSYFGSPSVEHNAMDIMDKKMAYDTRIAKLMDKYGRFRTFLQQIDSDASRLFRSYFEKGDVLPDENLNAALKRYCSYWDEYDTDRGRMLDEEAWDDFLIYRRQRAAEGTLDKKRKEFFSFSNTSSSQERWENSTL